MHRNHRQRRTYFPFYRCIYPAALFLGFLLLLLLTRNPPPSSTSHSGADGLPQSIYDITVKDIRGNDVSLGTYKGKVLLIVNVASKCGFTNSNYREMNILYDKYKNRGLEILAFPCNQFGGQEPGNNEEIEQVCKALKAKFPIFDKIEVNGENSSVLYKFLKAQKGGSLFGESIKWNFAKFLVDKDGNVVQRYSTTTSPLHIEDEIKTLLADM